MTSPRLGGWSTERSAALYRVEQWGMGYVRVNGHGHLEVCAGPADGGIDLKKLVDDLRRRGLALPILLRFTDLIPARVEALARAFEAAAAEHGYSAPHRAVYPIKVNQDAHLVDKLLAGARTHHMGLEAGSKPELQIALAKLEDPDALVICNGYKDRAYIQMALLARKLGRNCIIVVEQSHELQRIEAAAADLGIPPVIGVRAKLASRGSGRWHTSVGDTAKFGLTPAEIVALVHDLQSRGLLDHLQLLHFHIGSQVSNIRALSKAVQEATHIYAELRSLGAPMRYLDVGGGLGVDYDGSRTDFDSSMNYDAQEYAHAVLSTISEVCAHRGVPHPVVVTESGRALAAYHSALIVEVLSTSAHRLEVEPEPPADTDDADIRALWAIYGGVAADNLQEPYHDALEIRETCLTRFQLGLTSLEQRARVETLFWAICKRLHTCAQQADYVPEELAPLERALAQVYYCNFSVFQSAPDSWAIDQRFPILPIHRLDEEPQSRAILGDLTCDSDGVIQRFIARRGHKNVLEVHEPGAEPYYLGIFLVGAYQEILGDLHNLFGDTHAVHVSHAPSGTRYRLDHVVEGDTVMDVLGYVRYDRKELLKQLRNAVEDGIEREALTLEEGALLVRTYAAGLDSYTYLEG